MPELIAAKRDGHALTADEIEFIIQGFTRGDVPDYQLAALAMAVFFRGMTDDETLALTRAMRDSGDVIDLSDVPGRKVDKHSTGGVGDKVSICLAPLVAACGVKVPMVSGRGLGHTGGTLDKLEAIPGFSVSATVSEFRTMVRDVGTAMIGQTSEIAPADKKLYALRDVTATVESIPLIVASILSKKLAEGIDGLVLDVKVGRGAFMKTLEDARRLANALVRVARGAGKDCVALLTSMDAPLGRTVGNALETAEAFSVLQGRGPADLIECTMALGAEMLVMGRVATSLDDARERLATAVRSGAGCDVARRMIRAQHGDPRVVDEPDRLPQAPVRQPLRAVRAGWIAGIDGLATGLAGVALGAGRTRAEDCVDPSVGFVFERTVGDAVAPGDPIAWIHAANESGARDAIERLAAAVQIVDAAVPQRGPLVLERVA